MNLRTLQEAQLHTLRPSTELFTAEFAHARRSDVWRRGAPESDKLQRVRRIPFATPSKRGAALPMGTESVSMGMGLGR